MIYQIIEKVNTKEIMGEEIGFDDKERIVSELLASIHSKAGANNNMSSVRPNANAKYMYPVFFIPPHGKKKHRLVQGFLPKTNILAANYYELESLRIMTKFAPDNPQVNQMIEDTTQRLKNTCFGNFCMQGECLATGISVLRFLVVVQPGDKEWISKLLTPLGELFDTFGSGQAAIQKGIPVSYLLMAFTDINNDELMQIETKRLLIRDIKTDDAVPFAIMAADGTLNDYGFDNDCGNWITEWITEAKYFALRV